MKDAVSPRVFAHAGAALDDDVIIDLTDIIQENAPVYYDTWRLSPAILFDVPPRQKLAATSA